MNDILFILLTLIPIPFLIIFLRRIQLHIIESFKSAVSGQIHVRRSAAGEIRLYINDCLQGLSVNYSKIEQTYWWYLAQQTIKNTTDSPNVLISGLGANTVSSLILHAKPTAKITIVERDPLIVDLAKQHFQLDTSKVNIVLSDWYNYLQEAPSQTYDVIVNDLLTGEKGTSLPKCLTPEYLSQLKNLLSPRGVILYNIPYTATTTEHKLNFYEQIKQNSVRYSIHNIKHPYGFDNDELTITL